jgi:hypothetical protein
VSAVVTVALSGQVGSAFSRTLSHGFRLVHRTVDLSNCANCFEGKAHYEDLYHRKTRVADTVGQVSVSPSGRFAAFERIGKLMLFDRKTMKVRDITDGVFAIPERFNWQEGDNLLVVSYYKDHEPSNIALIAPK